MRYKSNLVLLEMLLALAFFATSAVIGAGVLATAYRISLDSRRQTDAMFIAQSWAERIAAADDPVAPLRQAGSEVEGNYRFQDGGYTVEAAVNPEDTGAGTLYDIRLTVLRSGQALCELPASRYVPREVSP